MTNSGISGLEAAAFRVAHSIGLATATGGLLVLARLYSISAFDAQTAAEIANHADFGSLLLMLFISALPTMISLVCAISLILICERVRAGRAIGLGLSLSAAISSTLLLVMVPATIISYLGPGLALVSLALTAAFRKDQGVGLVRIWSIVRAVTLVIILGITLNLILLSDRPMGQGVVVQTEAVSKEHGLAGSVVGYVLNSNESSLTLLEYRPRQVLVIDEREVVNISACKGSRSPRQQTPAEWVLQILKVSRTAGGDNPPCFPLDMP